jgi:hypothetical protein
MTIEWADSSPDGAAILIYPLIPTKVGISGDCRPRFPRARE